MINFPVLKTQRLLLNQALESDQEDMVFHLNEDDSFSENTVNIPFPYQSEDAESWINLANAGYKSGNAYIFAVRQQNFPALIGAVGLHVLKKQNRAELGYWIEKHSWNKGYASEAVAAVIQFGFSELKLNKIYATHYPHNPASGKVMQKCGMALEAHLRQEIKKGNQYFDIVRYAALKEYYVYEKSTIHLATV